MKKKVPSQHEFHAILYELLYALDDFCNEHKIKYFLGYGSLLGAIRHQGIIPWDDDADVMMERSEYERFQKLIIRKPPKGYRAYSIYNTKDYYYPFIKFGKLGTIITEPDWRCTPSKGIGINIDIFPIDGCPGGKQEACNYIADFFPKYLTDLVETFKPWREFSSRRQKIKRLLYFYRYMPFYLKRHFKNEYQRATKFQLCNTDYYTNLVWSFYGKKNVHATKNIKNIIRVPFGSRNLPIPEGYNEILTEEYGDYMIPPAEHEKKSTHTHGVIYVLSKE